MTALKIGKAEGTWSVRAGGAILVESRNALTLSEEGYPDIVYFPREDIAMAMLDQTDHSSHSPNKGDATYFSIVTNAQTLENAAWSFEAPLDEVAAIEGHVAFHATDEVTVERI